MIKRLLFISLVLVLLLSALAACAQPPAPAPSPTPSPAASPKPSPTSTPTPTATATAKPSPSPSAVKPIAMKWAGYFPVGDMRSKECESVIARLQERSNGRLKINFFPAEQLYNATELWNATRDGLIDIGWINTGSFSGQEPILELGTAPAGITLDNWTGMMRKDGLFDQVIIPALRKHNMVALWGIPVGSQILIFRNQVRKLEDMKGLKVRSTGGGTDRYFQLYGASPIRVASSEVYIAAQRGTIDGATHSITSYVAYKEWEVLPYMVDDKFGNGFSVQAMNVNSFNSLPADLQKLVVDTFLEEEASFLKTVRAFEDDQMALLKTKAGFDYYVLPPDELAKWVAARQPYWDDFVKRIGEPAAKAVVIMKNYWK